MPELFGINHLTLSTTDLDRLVAYYTELLGAVLAFERAATASDPRIAVIDIGGDDHLMIVETATAPPLVSTPSARPDGGCAWEHTRNCVRSANRSWVPDGRSDRSKHCPRSGR
ncbi:VOC family protein [Streptomyces sp. BE282]|uniref:VOC family protein n=1 Tax=Streptomyces sp. BE282 TaxID=3002527 RepID=UPI002E773493|nr:VOC family protein [Streptomyces sp. BE282]MEE1728710.1 VOC family protein [Streptomyces sp. BE282]